MSRTTRERLAGATLHLNAAIAYAADGAFDEKTIDVRTYTTSSGLSVGNSPRPKPTGRPSSNAVAAWVT